MIRNNKISIILKLKITKWLKHVFITIIISIFFFFKYIPHLKELIIVLTVLFSIEIWQYMILKNSRNNKNFNVSFEDSKHSKWSVILFSILFIFIGFYNISNIEALSATQICIGFFALNRLIFRTDWALIIENDILYTNSFFEKQITLSSINKMKITTDKELLIYYGNNKNIIPTLNEKDSIDLMNRIIEINPVEIIEN